MSTTTTRTRRTTAPTSPMPVPVVTSSAHVNNGAHSTPIIPSGVVDVTVTVEGRRFEASHAQYTAAFHGACAQFFAVSMTRPSGQRLELFEQDMTSELTLEEVRALTIALERIVQECKRQMPAVLAEAREMAATIERLGLNDVTN